jgi:hypothetical protein
MLPTRSIAGKISTGSEKMLAGDRPPAELCKFRGTPHDTAISPPVALD